MSWKRLIVSGSDAPLTSITGSGINLFNLPAGPGATNHDILVINPSTNDVYTTGSQQFLGGGGGGGITWNEVTGTSQNMSSNNGYISNNASQVDLTLPSSPTLGDEVAAAGKGAGGWKISQNASQVIHFGELDTTTGTGGSLESTHRYDTIQLLYIGNNEWIVRNSVGTITVN